MVPMVQVSRLRESRLSQRHAASCMTNKLDNCGYFDHKIGQMNVTDSVVLERQLLLQLGDRLKRLRKSQRLSAVETAKRAGISRTTLGSVEAGDPGPSIGTYLRVMSILGVSGELALLAGDALQPGPSGSAGARSKRARPVVQVTVSADESRHQLQDLQSLALHEEAVRLVRADPALLRQAQETLDRWLGAGSSRTSNLWSEWQEILREGRWRRILGKTRRAQELRQASPLTAVLPEPVRQNVLAQVGQLRHGVVLGDSSIKKPT